MITVVGAAHCFRRVYVAYIGNLENIYDIIIYLKSTHGVPHALFGQMTQTSYMGVEHPYIYEHLTTL